MLEPLSFASGTETVGVETPGFTLAEFDHGSSETEVRFVEVEVTFARPFAEAPVVQVALAGFDISDADCARLRVRAESIHPAGFTLRVETWLHTRVWSTTVSWLAIGR